MKIAILGSGGREHALCHSLKKSKRIKNLLYSSNVGTQSIAENLEIDINDHKKLEKIIREKNIEIVVIGPEKPLVDGLTDILQKNKIKVLVQIKFVLNWRIQNIHEKTFAKIQYS